MLEAALENNKINQMSFTFFLASLIQDLFQPYFMSKLKFCLKGTNASPIMPRDTETLPPFTTTTTIAFTTMLLLEMMRRL